MAELDLSGRRALVTGGGSGIGAAIARRLGAAGADVVVADIDAGRAAAVATECGGRPWVVDLADTAALAAADAGVVPDVDVLVNNAGIQHVARLEEFPPERFAFMLRLMLEAPFLLIRAVLPSMYRRGWGRIVNISSAHGLRASAYKSAYVTAKHGLEGLSKVTALEGAAHGVTSNCVNPGYVRTPLVEAQIADQARVHELPEERVVSEVLLANEAIKRLIEPGEVAEAVAHLCGPAAQSTTGTNLVIDGGWSAR
ncbi:3-hydroxybutyrate dehydrogenase [Jiangella asiatica]|uniref:3-hydroxybutyrate dehydrogenase n=1 Tax=Jiangella asiatica TaxID=2530372 RepID=A0A4R5CNC2_9ACTN|nr:3-hydroxybutyrate dehydrogenase [Jiangella asiatica]TDD99074.1 3-hydroxybutyrate dehydrogenase [Jiangella asiatica]